MEDRDRDMMEMENREIENEHHEIDGIGHEIDAMGHEMETVGSPAAGAAAHGAPTRHTGRRLIAWGMAASILLSGAMGFGGGYMAFRLGQASTTGATSATSVNSAVAAPSGTAAAGQFTAGTMPKVQTVASPGVLNPLPIPQIAAKAMPSVVEISTEVLVGGQRVRQYVTEGAGSGVIISADGYIVTNNHVIENAQKITVRLTNGDTFDATLAGTDPQMDVAVLKIKASGLVPATFGSSASLVVGDLAVAIGNPLGELGGTVTDGIISALDREITLDDETMNLLQTNASINPGNSGGGLFDGQGNLIGIVVAKSSGSDVEGLGFAIPIDDARAVIEELRRFGYVRGRIELGLSLVDIASQQEATRYRVSTPGVYIAQVTASGSAGLAGLNAGDRIVSANGAEVKTSADFQAIIEQHKVGDALALVVQRGSQQVTINLVLQESRPATAGTRA